MTTSAVLDRIADMLYPLAMKEQCLRMADAWINRFGEWDAERRTLAVETGFSIALDARTYVIGVCDRVAEDEIGPITCEWKTTKEPQYYKSGVRMGQPYEGWNEQVWLSEIARGPQLAIYAMALQEGTFYPPNGARPLSFSVQQPRVLVRAAIKSAEPSFWPSDNMGYTITFPQEALAATRAALLNRADQIRALRVSGRLPWQTTGRHCISRYDRKTPCVYYEKHCAIFQPPLSPAGVSFDQNDPAHKVFARLTQLPSDAVLLSASSYDTGNECMEKYRIVNHNLLPKESSEALEMGACFHECLAAHYSETLA